MKYIPFLFLTFIIGCVSAQGRFSGTGINSPEYGSANSINAEGELNAAIPNI